MKNIVGIMALALGIILAACAGDSSRDRLRAQVEALDSACPLSMGATGHLESVTYDSETNEVLFSYNLSRYCRVPNELDTPTPEQKRALANFLQGAEGRRLLMDFDRAGVDVVLAFAIPDQPMRKVRLTAGEIHQMASELSTIDTVREELTDDPGALTGCWREVVPAPFRLDSIGNTGDRMVWYVTAPDTMDLSTSQALRAVRLGIHGFLTGSGPRQAIDSVLSVLADGHLGASYVISEESDSLVVTVDFAPAEVAAMR